MKRERDTKRYHSRKRESMRRPARCMKRGEMKKDRHWDGCKKRFMEKRGRVNKAMEGKWNEQSQKRIDGKRRDELAALRGDVQWATTQLLTSPSYSQYGIFPLNNSQVEGYTDAHIFLHTVHAHALTEPMPCFSACPCYRWNESSVLWITTLSENTVAKRAQYDDGNPPP